MTTLHKAFVTLALLSCACSGPAPEPTGDTEAIAESAPLVLHNDAIELQVIPRLGGRAVHFSRRGRSNLLLAGDAIHEHPEPEVGAEAGNIPYLGHEIWTGPQSGWWLDQDVNPARREAEAIWPPDPWQAFGSNDVLEHGAQVIHLQGPASPVSGLQISQRHALSSEDADTLELQVEARNIRDTPVTRDIWFNTRVAPTMRVFVPASADGVRVRSDIDEVYAELVPDHADGLFSLLPEPPPPGKQGRRGKVFIQPDAGWMAGFTRDQMLLIRFERQPPERIHPEQGQIELYLDWRPVDAGTVMGTGIMEPGVMELEVHAPLRTLQPGESMLAREWWTALPYDGVDERTAQVAFLRAHADELGIEVP